MGYKDVCPCLCHFERIAGIENIGRGQQTERVRLCNHFYLEVIAHAGLFEMETKHSIVEPDCREVLYSRESSVFQLFKKNRFEAKRVGAADSSQHGSVLDHRQHLAAHVHNDRVGVAVGHHPRQRAAPGHPVAPRAVDDDQVGAALLRALGRQAGTGAGADDRPAFPHDRVQSPQAFRSRKHSLSLPGISCSVGTCFRTICPR